jgi:hypothetical protein
MDGKTATKMQEMLSFQLKQELQNLKERERRKPRGRR